MKFFNTGLSKKTPLYRIKQIGACFYGQKRVYIFFWKGVCASPSIECALKWINKDKAATQAKNVPIIKKVYYVD